MDAPAADSPSVASPTPDRASRRTVVVGTDGSNSAQHAVRWAAGEAILTDAALRIVSVWCVPTSGWAGTVGAAYVDAADVAKAARLVVERAEAAVREEFGPDTPPIERATPEGVVADRLIDDAAGSGSLLVVGSRGRGGFASLVLGSVSAACAHHARVPLVVVGPDGSGPGSGDIVVGLDSSAGSRQALRWALAEGRSAGRAVRVVHGLEVPLAAAVGAAAHGAAAESTISDTPLAELQRIVDEERAALVEPPPVTIVTAPFGPPELLLREAKSGALLVVGSRGRGGFSGLLLGSVSQQCLHHTPCPIVIVPDPERADDGAPA